MRPFLPMSPILTDVLPEGEEWTYQLKWDGFRTIARVDNGRVDLFSKGMLPKNSTYPELVRALSHLKGTYILDGEAVVLDPATGRPSFQRMQQRDKLKQPAAIARAMNAQPIQYVLFDVLEWNGRSLWQEPLELRDEALRELFPEQDETVWISDRFDDGDSLWEWVLQNDWEGVVCKQLASPYVEGKDHRSWFKRKTVRRYEAEAVGITYKEGRLASLVMMRGGQYFGKVSAGLNEETKEQLAALPSSAAGAMSPYFAILPEELRRLSIRWLQTPIPCTVTGRETTQNQLLRHPKLQRIGGMTE